MTRGHHQRHAGVQPQKGGWDELSFQDVMQMMAEPVVLNSIHSEKGSSLPNTRNCNTIYLYLINNYRLKVNRVQAWIRLNAEIVLGSIASVDDAVKWLGYTYLFVRMLRNPVLYGVPRSAVDDDPTSSSRRADLEDRRRCRLTKSVNRYDKRGGGLQANDLGRIASQHYVSTDGKSVPRTLEAKWGH